MFYNDFAISVRAINLGLGLFFEPLFLNFFYMYEA